MLSPEEWDVLSLSLRVALGCVVITLPPAVALGWLLARRAHFVAVAEGLAGMLHDK